MIGSRRNVNSIGRSALGEGFEEDGNLRGGQRVREAGESRTRVTVGRQSLMHDDGSVGSPNPNGSEPDGTTV